MNKKAKGLGRGLDALLGADRGVTAEVREVPVTDITPNPEQPRRHFDEAALAELAASIRTHGIIQPLIVQRATEGFLLVAGERRLRAAELAGLATVPVLVKSYDDAGLAEVALIENLQREDLNPIEEAAAYYRLRDEFSLTQAEIAERVGRSRPYIANMMRLLQLPEEIRELLRLGRVTVGQVRPLTVIGDPDEAVRLARKIVAENLTARQVEELVAEPKKIAAKSASKKMDAAWRAYLDKTAETLKMELGTAVTINASKDGKEVRGTICVHFAGAAELERLLEYFS